MLSVVVATIILLLSLNTNTTETGPTILITEDKKGSLENQTFVLASNRPEGTAIFDVHKALEKLVLGRSDLYVDDENVVLPLLELPEFKGKITVAGVLCETSLHIQS